MAYEWDGGQPLRRVRGENVEVGETFEPTDAELNSFDSAILEVETSDVNPGVTQSESDESDYASMDYAELRELAANAETDAINGRSSKADIISHFEGE